MLLYFLKITVFFIFYLVVLVKLIITEVVLGKTQMISTENNWEIKIMKLTELIFF